MSESDSGPEDRTPAKKKVKVTEDKEKSKPSAGDKRAKSGGGASASADGSMEFKLSNQRMVTVSEFRGKTYVGIREYYMDDEGNKKPGKKGISLPVEQWKKLKDLIGDVDDAIKSME